MMRCVEGFVVQTYPHPDRLDSFCNLMGRTGAHWTTSTPAEPGKLHHEAERKPPLNHVVNAAHELTSHVPETPT